MKLAIVAVAVSLIGCGSSTGLASPQTGSAPTTLPSASVPAPSASADATACAPVDVIECKLQAIEAAGARGDFAGVILIAHDNEPDWIRAFGLDEAGQPMQVDTRLGIASAGKMFTAVAVAQLVQDGRLRFTDTVGAYVADLPADVSKATIQRLLSHTSGMGMMSWIHGLSYEPGEFNYSNAGFNLLAQVVEAITDTTFADYLGQHVFDPAGMDSIAYERAQPRGAPLGAGGQLSTTEDLLRFEKALFSHKLLDEATLNVVTKSKVSTTFGGYAYGFAIFEGEADEIPSIGHIGAAPHIVSAVEMNPRLGYTVIVVCRDGFGSIEPALIDFQRSIGMGYWRG